jgi:hypothetical protein
MKLKITFILLFPLIYQPALAENHAVNQLNVDLGPSFTKVEDVSDSFNIDVDLSLPLGPAAGMSLTAGVGTASSDDDYYDDDSTTTLIGAEFFAGHYETGRVGFGFGYDNTSINSSYYSDDPTATTQIAYFFGELFLADVTLGVASGNRKTEYEINGYDYGDDESNTKILQLNYYPTNNVSIGIGQVDERAIGIGDDMEERFANLEFQVGSRVSIFMEYSSIDADDDFGDATKMYLVGATLYFSGGDTLKDNDRWY